MKIKGPTSPLSSGSEPLEPLSPRDLRKAVEGERFASSLSQLEATADAPNASGTGQASGSSSATRSALEQIAASSNLTTSEGAASAVRESARYMIRSRLSDRYRDTEHGERLTSELSDFVAADPFLKSKLLSILQKLQARS